MLGGMYVVGAGGMYVVGAGQGRMRFAAVRCGHATGLTERAHARGWRAGARTVRAHAREGQARADGQVRQCGRQCDRGAIYCNRKGKQHAGSRSPTRRHSAAPPNSRAPGPAATETARARVQRAARRPRRGGRVRMHGRPRELGGAGGGRRAPRPRAGGASKRCRPGTVARHFGGRVKGAVGEFEWQPRPEPRP